MAILVLAQHRTHGCCAVANCQREEWPLYLRLSLCCVAVLFEPIAGTRVDGKYSCADLFSACLSFAVSAALRVAWGCRASASTARQLFERRISNYTSAFSGHCEFLLQLPWTVNHAERCEARHRLEVAKGIPAASR